MNRNPNLFHKILVAGIIILFFGLIVNPSIAYVIKQPILGNLSGNTLYVGGSGEGNYTKIQDAIDNASNGDTVFVYEDSSPYNEDVIIDKGIKLVGEDKNTTLINGSKFGVVVIITSDNVLISGFMIHGHYADGLIINSNNNIVSNNFFSNCYRSIDLNHSTSGNKIFQNIINDSVVGIKLRESSSNKIYNNLFSNNLDGMLVWYESVNNQIVNNTFESSRDLGIRLSTTSATLSGNIFSNNSAGIVLSYCSDNIIKNNCFINDGLSIWESYRNNVENNTINEKPLIYLEEESDIIIDDFAGQVFLVSCNNITVRNHEFLNVSIGVGLIDTVDSKIENNIISNVNKYAIKIDNCENITIDNNIIENPMEYYAIASNMGLFNCTIKNNEIKNTDTNAIYMSGLNNNIFGNNISNNANGICIGGCNNTIINNQIYNNQYRGVRIGYNSENNTVLKNNIVNNDIGIKAYSDHNLIIKNNITNNNLGIDISSYYNYSFYKIYYNNFKNNNQNAYDNGNNTWDNGYPRGGNYWDDYNGIDEDGDGIGDTPYPIPGGDNKDRYPLMEPWNYTYPVANFTYNAEESPVLFDGSSSYDFDGDIISYEWNFGDGTTGTGETIFHKYCEVGTYDVVLTVTDDDGLKDKITKSVDVKIANTPPEIEIYGPSSGKPGIEYEFTINVTDPDGDDNFIYIDWGDGTFTDWMGPYGSGNPEKISHIWAYKGSFLIKVAYKDTCGESGWSEPFEINIPKNKNLLVNLLLRFLERVLDLFPILKNLFGLPKI